jgi:hypothetical protein
VTLNSSNMLVGGNASGGTITYGTGTDAVAIATITNGANSVGLLTLNNGDSIAESSFAFSSATVSGSGPTYTLTLTGTGANTGQTATFNNVTFAAGASHTFEPVTTETIGGNTYYVATLDPPAGPTGSGPTGSGPTGATSPTGGTGAAGAHGATGPAGGGSHDHHLTAAINPGNLSGPQDQAFAPKFLTSAGATPSAGGTTTIVLSGDNQAALIRAGTDYVRNFNLAEGDKLDLTKILAGAPLAHDLANLGNFVKVLGYGQNDPGFGAGTKTSLEVTGPHGSAVVNLEGSGKLELGDLLKHHSLLLPPH